MGMIPPVCNFGWQAVDAELPATDGKRYRVSKLAGPNGLVVVFICNHCPYVKAVIDQIVREASELATHGIGFIAVSSNDANAYPEDSFANMGRFAAAHDFSFPYLYDEDQSLARAYDAACTPDFFGFNRDLKLQYRGRLDAAGRSAATPGMRRDLYEGMVQIAQTGEGPSDQIASIGCSIKWKHVA